MLTASLSAVLAAGLILFPSTEETSDTAVIIARTTADGLAVEVQLPAPTRRMVLGETGVPRDRWRVLTAGLTLDGDAVVSATPFSEVALSVQPDAQEADRIYPALAKVGTGWQIHGPAFRLKDMPTRLLLEPKAGEISAPHQGAIGGYAFLGPERLVSMHDGMAMATGENVPTELADRMQGDFFAAARFYASAFDLPAPGQTLLILSTDSPGPSTFRGDVTDGGVISLRFHNEDWRHALEPLSTFVWHETFHRWEGERARDASTAPWLHEGGAEYAAILGAVTTGRLNEDDAKMRLSTALNDCRTTLEDNAIEEPSFRRNPTPYRCGVLIQWLVDMERRAQGETVLTLWGDMLKHASESYGVADYRAGLKQDSLALLIIDHPSENRWAKLREGLTAFGVVVENRPSDRDLMGKALFHVGGQNCQGSYGFFDDPGALKLDGDHCGPLSGAPVIDKVEGFDPQKETPAMFLAVQARCASKQSVRYLTRDGKTLEAVCDKALEEPEVWSITDAPKLAIS